MTTKTMLAAMFAVAASIASASAANYIDDTVGTINGKTRTLVEATNNTVSATTFSSDIATAFANDTGGVWDFDGAAFTVGVGETITLDYGTSLANSLVLTLSSGNTIDQSNIPGETSSGDFQLGLVGDSSTRTFTLSTPLVELGIISTNRGDAGRLPVLTVNFQGGGTASTTGANAGAWYFHGFTATEANPIVSFSLEQSAFVRYDDLGFVVVPEPSTIVSLLGGVGILAMRRRRNVKA